MDKNQEKNIQSSNDQMSDSSKYTDFSSVFSVNGLFPFISKKTEKLATAVYMVTNLFYESEPMKWTLRKKISDLLSFVLKHRDTYMAGNIEFVHDTKKSVAEVLSLLEVASGSGLISTMNFSILHSEFINLIRYVERLSQQSIEDDHHELSKTFFDVQKNLKDSISQSFTGQDSSLSDIGIKDKLGVQNDNTLLKKTNRQHIILQLLKKKKEVSIKDIALVIKDCSEKTIQREVIDLIEKGVLKKTGDRRWSRYSLLTNL